MQEKATKRPSSRTLRHCVECGVRISEKPSTQRCRPCASAKMRTRIEKVCERCSKPFWVKPYRESGGRSVNFCSAACATVPVESRFWAMVSKGAECWEWTGSVPPTGGGYGFFEWKGKPERAHRVSWEMEHGAIPAGLYVLHRCDNPPCVRPDHLFLGTHADNIRDMTLKGRAASGYRNARYTKPERTARGERSRHAKLTAAGVQRIRAEFAGGVITVAALAKREGVTWRSMKNVLERKAWAHID